MYSVDDGRWPYPCHRVLLWLRENVRAKRPQIVLSSSRPTQFKKLHYLMGHQAQESLWGLIKLSRLVIEHADRAERKAFRRLQKRARTNL